MVAIQPGVQSPSRKLANRSIQACLHIFLQFASDFMIGMSGNLSHEKFICAMRKFCEKVNSITVIPSEEAKSRYFCHS